MTGTGPPSMSSTSHSRTRAERGGGSNRLKARGRGRSKCSLCQRKDSEEGDSPHTQRLPPQTPWVLLLPRGSGRDASSGKAGGGLC